MGIKGWLLEVVVAEKVRIKKRSKIFQKNMIKVLSSVDFIMFYTFQKHFEKPFKSKDLHEI